MADLPSIADLYAADAGQPTAQVSQQAAADKMLHLSPEERALYERHIANLWGPGGVDHSDGSRSSLYVVGTDHAGRTYNVPSVYDGKILEPDAAVDRAKEGGIERFPSYGNPDVALDRYVGEMHPFMNKDTGTYMDIRRRAPMVPVTMADMFK